MDTNTAKVLIAKEIVRVFDRYNAIFPNHAINPADINITYNLRGTTAGKAGYAQKIMQFNLILAAENISQFLADTVPHEIAHLYQRKMYPFSKPHGREWKSVMIAGGYNPTRCHNYDTQTIKAKRAPKQYVKYGCECGKVFDLTKNMDTRIQKGSTVRVCRRCRGVIYRLNPKYAK